MKFYNREGELAELCRIRDLSFSRNSRMTVVTGRRRIGKTSLIKRAFCDSDVPMLYFFAKRRTEADLVAGFVAEVKRQRGNYDHKAFMAKVERISHTALAKYEIETRLLTIEDM